MGSRSRTKIVSKQIFLCLVCDQIVESDNSEFICQNCKQQSDFVAIYVEDNALVQSYFSDIEYLGG